MDRVIRNAVRVLAVVAVAAGLVVALRGVSAGELLRALRSANVWPGLGSVVLLLGVGPVLRTARFRALLPRGGVPFGDVLGSVVLSQAANNVLPLRAGELVRTRELVVSGYPVARVAAAQVAEKVVEVVTLVACVAPVMVTKAGYRQPAVVIASVVLLASPFVARISGRFGVDRAQLGRALAWSLGADVLEVCVIALCLKSLGLSAGLMTSVLVFAAVNLAIALPSTPANLGALEAGAALALVATGVAHDAAVAFAVLYRAVQWLPITLAGGAVWAWRSAGASWMRTGAP